MPELLPNLAEADRVNADAIIVGPRGRSGQESALLGSVSHALLAHADRPVLVAPFPQIAEHRRDKRHTTEQTPV